MFQLIVTIISIALIVALALASIFYGGSAFTNSAAKTAEAALVNGGQQIAGASILYQNDFAGAFASIDNLIAGNGVTSYLSSRPSVPSGVPGQWKTSTDNTVAYVEISAAVETIASNTTVARVVNDTNFPVAALSSGISSATANGTATFVAGQTFGIFTDTATYFAYKL